MKDDSRVSGMNPRSLGVVICEMKMMCGEGDVG